ncbi:MAG: Glucose-fructose oxidoreductase [uncultured Thermomicrobiales bacterium]|uniref:Glucose-fructose oxidoreductase n=1 Tax=uncultured Thermomicrobiales bacterium TaxID=1645740 RepID=A0A6J4UMD9_9BACT|nr:MAG: Glucose-fructose oxidoreductase [uncultured Thermomicrobiales bacterium]
MEQFRVGIIGCGRPRQTEGATGFGMSHFHARGYAESPDARIVALADLNEDNARAFQAEHGGDRIYQDYREMLREERLDIVSVCTWPQLHAEMVIAVAEAGVRAIHCEKPMAPTWGEATRMARACDERGVQLTFNHQRRFSPQFRQARELLRSGAIGSLVRLEGSCSNLFDWGTHWFDMFFFYNEETPVEWVLGQIEPAGGRAIFNVPVEGQGLSYFRFRNGVHGLLTTSMEPTHPLSTRLVGTEGMIEADAREAPLRLWGRGQSGWQAVALDGDVTIAGTVARGVLDLIDALKSGREPELSARRALGATELIFATYESSRRRGRVDLPLAIDDSPFLARLAEGAVPPAAHG